MGRRMEQQIGWSVKTRSCSQNKSLAVAAAHSEYRVSLDNPSAIALVLKEARFPGSALEGV